MTREEHLRAGGRENARGFILYWEPYHAKRGEIKHAFTVDKIYDDSGMSHTRWRFDTLEEADAHIKQLSEAIAVELAIKVLKLN